MWKKICEQCQPEEAHDNATQQAEGSNGTNTDKSDEEEAKANWVIILCAVARFVFANLNPTHAKKLLNFKYTYLILPSFFNIYINDSKISLEFA